VGLTANKGKVGLTANKGKVGLTANKGKVGLTANKKRKYLTNEAWTDAVNIFSSVVRQCNPYEPHLPEALAIYMHSIRSIHKDGGTGFIMM
jgi:hypothetical protein